MDSINYVLLKLYVLQILIHVVEKRLMKSVVANSIWGSSLMCDAFDLLLFLYLFLFRFGDVVLEKKDQDFFNYSSNN